MNKKETHAGTGADKPRPKVAKNGAENQTLKGKVPKVAHEGSHGAAGAGASGAPHAVKDRPAKPGKPGKPGKAPKLGPDGRPLKASKGTAHRGANGRPAPVGAAGAAGLAGRANKRTILLIVGIIVIAAVIWLLVWMFACRATGIFDPDAQTGQAPYKTAEEIQAELDRQVDEGMFNISIASVIEFADGTSSGIAYIENVPGNRYDMQVTITDDDTGDTLYESGVLQPNQFIEKISLTKDLDAGTYPATATFTALDPTTHDEIGKAAAKVTLNVAS